MLVLNKESLQQFLDSFYHNNTGLVQLQVFARKKYNETLTASEMPLMNQFIDPSFDSVYKKLRQLEVGLDASLYLDKNSNVIPIDSLAVYLSAKTVDIKKSTVMMINELTESLYKNQYQDLHTLSKRVMSKCMTSNDWMVVDLDVPTLNKEALTLALGNDTCYRVTKTRGGFHVWVNTSQTTNSMWYKQLSTLEGFDTKVNMTPVWGCVQGGFMVDEYK